MASLDVQCPGCGLGMPRKDGSTYDGYFNTSPECWAVFGEVLAAEFSNAFLFGRVHQITVDTYAVQHAGGKHPDKSVAVHLSGLHLVQDRGFQPTSVPPLLQQLAATVEVWLHFDPPMPAVAMTVFDVALAESVEDHIKLVREWSSLVWKSWSNYHPQIVNLCNILTA